jgi:hypothetical protein
MFNGHNKEREREGKEVNKYLVVRYTPIYAILGLQKITVFCIIV